MSLQMFNLAGETAVGPSVVDKFLDHFNFHQKVKSTGFQPVSFS
jgi:hypothetical protein